MDRTWWTNRMAAKNRSMLELSIRYSWWGHNLSDPFFIKSEGSCWKIDSEALPQAASSNRCQNERKDQLVMRIIDTQYSKLNRVVWLKTDISKISSKQGCRRMHLFLTKEQNYENKRSSSIVIFYTEGLEKWAFILKWYLVYLG